MSRNNKGFSLIELLVAFAVSAVVLAGLGLLMINVMNIFARTNANVELQNESQTAMNLVIDNIMDATGLCMIEPDSVPVPGDSGNTPVCVLLGEVSTGTPDFNSASFVGDAVIWDPDTTEMYLKTFRVTDGALDTSGASSESEAALKAIAQVQNQVLSLSQENRRPFLMAKNVTVFDLRPASYYIFPDSQQRPDPDHPGVMQTVNLFKDPMILTLHMEFETEYQNGKTLTREMKEDIAIRNRLPYIYLERAGKSMIKFYLNS